MIDVQLLQRPAIQLGADLVHRSPKRLGAAGDFIGDQPVNAVIHPAGLPIDTSKIEVLRRPVELTLYPSVLRATVE